MSEVKEIKGRVLLSAVSSSGGEDITHLLVTPEDREPENISQPQQFNLREAHRIDAGEIVELCYITLNTVNWVRSYTVYDEEGEIKFARQIF